MKKVLFLIAAIVFSFQIIAQNNPAGDTCLPVPWVNAEIQINENIVHVSWDIPCDTCDVLKYQLAWMDAFDPCAGGTPEDSDWHHRIYTNSLTHNEELWGPRPWLWMAWSIRVIYDSCQSIWIYSNVVYKDFNYYSLTVDVSLEGGGNPERANVYVDGANLCTDSLSYFEQSDTGGNTYFEEIMYGEYMLTISKAGYQTALIEDFILYKDSTIMVELQEGLDSPPTEFIVDANNGMASWQLPVLRNTQNTPISFRVKLADSLVATLETDKTNYQFESLLHDTEYTASISAIYDWGESENVSYNFVTDFVGINENMGSAKVEIFPNPASNQFTIQSEEEILQIELVNFVGQIVLEKSVNGNQIIISTSALKTGIYIVRVRTNKGVANKRIVVSN